MLVLSIIGVILSYSIELCILSTGMYAIIGRKNNAVFSIIIYMIIILVIDMLLLPIAIYLDINLIIGNGKVCDFLDLHKPLSLTELTIPDILDISIYFMESIIIYFIGKYLYQRFVLKNNETNCSEKVK